MLKLLYKRTIQDDEAAREAARAGPREGAPATCRGPGREPLSGRRFKSNAILSAMEVKKLAAKLAGAKCSFTWKGLGFHARAPSRPKTGPRGRARVKPATVKHKLV